MKKSIFSKKTITASIAVVLSAALVVTSINLSRKEAQAKETFSGIREIVEDNSQDNPFVVLEVTPGKTKYQFTDSMMQEHSVDVGTGQIGYLIGGEEPSNFENLLGELTTYTDRKALVDKYYNIADSSGALASITSVSENSSDFKPLEYAKYQEKYCLTYQELEENSASQNSIEWKEIIFNGDHEDTVSCNRAVPAISSNNITVGRVVKQFAPLDTSLYDTVIADYTGSGYFDAATAAGDFSPAFDLVTGGAGQNNVAFAPNYASAGYVVANYIALSDEDLSSGEFEIGGNTYSLSGNYIYSAQNIERLQFECLGKFEDLSLVTSDFEREEYDRDEERDWIDIPELPKDPDDKDEGGIEGGPADEPADNPGDDNPGDDNPGDAPADNPDDGEPADKPEDDNDNESPATENAQAKVETIERFLQFFAAEPGDGPGDAPKEDEPKKEEPGDEPKKEEPGDEPKKDEPKKEEPGDEPKKEEPGDEPKEEPGDEPKDEEPVKEDQPEVVPEEISDVEDDEITVFSGELGDYFIVTFKYESAYNPDKCHYSVKNYSANTDGAYAGYDINSAKAVYPDYAFNGPLKSVVQVPDYYFRYEGALNSEKMPYGNYELVYDEGVTEPLRLFNVSVYYTGGFKNDEWFKKYVFDREFDPDTGDLIENVEMIVNSLKPEDAIALEPSGLGLLYLSTGTTSFLPDKDPANTHYPNLDSWGYNKNTNDISAKWVKSVVEEVLDSDLPVIVDIDLITEAKYDDTNMQLLARLLQLQNLSAFYRNYRSYSPEDFVKAAKGEINKYSDDNTAWFNKNKKSHHVNESIYIYNRNDIVNLVNTKFLDESDYNDSDCFGEITELIRSERFYLENDNKDPNLIPYTINEAVAIKYILSFAKRRSAYTKNEINVLEIEPCTIPSTDTGLNANLSEGHLYVVEKDGKYSLYRRNKEAFDKSAPEKCGSPIFKDNINPINLTRTDPNALAGIAADINSTYDLVYIGLNTASFYKDSTTGRTVFNDSKMDGLVYMNIGDKVRASQGLSGLMDRDKGSDGKVITIGWGYKGDAGIYRYGGNDLTKSKADELLSFVKAGYPVLVDYNCFYGADKFSKDVYDKDADNKNGYIDNCSNMYKFLYKASKNNKVGVNTHNLIRLKSSDMAKASQNNIFYDGTEILLQNYVNLPKPELDLDTGVSWTDSAQPAYKHSDGQYYLDYQFEILDRRVTDSDFNYTVELYIDKNVDGRFANEEKQEGFKITKESGSGVSAKELKKGTTYCLSMKVPDEIDGPIPWKLVVRLNSENLGVEVDEENGRRDYEIGCYKLHIGPPAKVAILQILSEVEGAKWDLSAGGTTGSAWSFDSYFKTLKSEGFYDVSIETVSNSEFIRNIKMNPNYLDNYSVVVLGFAYNNVLFMDDVDRYLNYMKTTGGQSTYTMEQAMADAKSAQDKVVNYIESGRAAVVGSGLTMTANADKNANSDTGDLHGHYEYYTTKAFREIIGQDRYGILNEKTGPALSRLGLGSTINKGSDKYDTIVKDGRDVGFVPNSANEDGDGGKICSEPQGFASPVLDYCWPKVYGNNPNKYHIYGVPENINEYKGLVNNTLDSGYARLLNKGELSLYPYAVEESYPFNTTRHPIYSLDLDSQDADGENEVMVWFAVDYDSHTHQFSRDARDKYFVYTKDNITYAGMCQTGTDTNILPLMVNILIAAFESGITPPTVHIVDNATDRHDVETLRITYDEYSDTEGYTQDVYFYTNGNKEQAKLLANYYYQVSSAAELTGPNDIIYNQSKGTEHAPGADNNDEEGDVLIYLKYLNPGSDITSVVNTVDNTAVGMNNYVSRGVTYSGYDILNTNVYKIELNFNEAMKKKLKDDNGLNMYVRVKSFIGVATDYDMLTGFDNVVLVPTELFSLD